MRRSGALLALLLVGVLMLAGCGKPSIEGEWVGYGNGWQYNLVVDNEWIHEKQVNEKVKSGLYDVADYRYTVDGETSLKVESEGKSDNWGYSLSGDTLTITNGSALKPQCDEWYRSGSDADKKAKAVFDERWGDK